MALEPKQPEMEEKIKQDNLKIQDNKVEVKKEPEDPDKNGEIGENMNNILNRMVQLGDKVFVPVSDEKEKMESVHEGNKPHEGDKPFKCTICYTCFSQNHHLKGHMESVHEEKNPFQCDNCDFSTSQKSNLKIHKASVHEGKKPYQCITCGANFAQKIVLKRHMESIHEKNKPYRCEICEYRCSQKGDLAIHFKSKRHFEIAKDCNKTFSCSVCKKRFVSKSKCHIHNKNMHEGKAEFKKNPTKETRSLLRNNQSDLMEETSINDKDKNRFKCEACNETFSEKVQIIQHVLKVHEEKMPELNKLYKCHICDLSFGYEQSLALHRCNLNRPKNSDQKEVDKPFKCEVCSAGFMLVGSLNMHSKLVHGVKNMFICKLCNVDFKFEKTLNKHHEVVHEGRSQEKDEKTANEINKTMSELNTDIQDKIQTEDAPSIKIVNVYSLPVNEMIKEHESKNIEKLVKSVMTKQNSNNESSATKEFPENQTVHENEKDMNSSKEHCNENNIPELSNQNQSKEIEVKENFGVITVPEKIGHNFETQIFSKTQDRASYVSSFHCSICKIPFSSKLHLNKHHLERHSVTVHERKNKIEVEESHSVKSVSEKKGHKIEVKNPAFTSLECSICNVCFPSKSYLNSHTSTVHKGKYRHHCSHCNDYFYNEYNLKEHISNVHERKNSIQKDNFEVQGPNQFKCKKCDANFFAIGGLNDHIIKIHGVVESIFNFKCNICGNLYKNNVDLKTHNETVHEQKNPSKKNIDLKGNENSVQKYTKNFKCKLCESKFDDIRLIFHHMTNVHEWKYPFKCDFCNEILTNRIMYKHNKESHGYKFKCNSCNYEFLQIRDLEQHVATKHMKSIHEGKQQLENETATVHEIEKPKDYNEGDQSFKISDGETRVIKTGHEKAKQTKSSEQTVPIPNPSPSTDKSETSINFKPEYNDVKKHFETEKLGKKRFTCNICHQNFILYKSLLKHIGSDHEKEKAFKCKLCEASFSLEKSLVLHITAHDGKNIEEKMDQDQNDPVHEKIEPYKCSLCNKTFDKTSKHFVSQLKNHLEDQHMKQISKVHEGKSVQCPFCNMKTIDSYKLKEHIDSEHSSIVHDGKNPNQIEDATSQVESAPKRKAPVFPRNCLTSSDLDQYQNPPINSQKLPENTNFGALKNHIISVHKDENTPYNQLPTQKEDMLQKEDKEQNTQKEVHGGENAPHNGITFDCAICGKPYMDKQDLSKHVSEVHDGYQSSFQLYCYACNDKFYILSDLKYHIKVCRLCYKHRKSIHEKKKSSVCKVCNIDFQWKNTLKKHHEVFHGGKNQAKDAEENSKTILSTPKENLQVPKLNSRLLTKNAKSTNSNNISAATSKNQASKGVFNLLFTGNKEGKKVELKKGTSSSMSLNVNKMPRCKICNVPCISEYSLNSHMTLVHEGKKQQSNQVSNGNLDVEMIPINKENENSNHEQTIQELNEDSTNSSFHEEKKHHIECKFDAHIIEVKPDLNKLDIIKEKEINNDNLDVEMIAIEEEKEKLKHENTMKELSEHNNKPSVHEEKKHQIECNFDARIIEVQPDYLNKSDVSEKDINNDISEQDPLDLTPNNEELSNSSNDIDMISKGEENYETVCNEITNKVINEENKSVHEGKKHQSNDQIMKTVNLDANQTTTQIHFLPTINSVTLLKKSQNGIGTFIKMSEEKPLKRPISTKKLALEKNRKQKNLRHILPKSKSSNDVNNKHQKCNENEKDVASVHESKNIGSVREGKNIASVHEGKTIESVHEEKNQTSETTFYCTVCYDKFPDSNSFTSHMDKAHNKKIYACNICHRRYKNKRSYNLHIESAHKQELDSNLKENNDKSVKSYSNVNHQNLHKKAEGNKSNKIRSDEDRNKKMVVQVKRIHIESLKCHICEKIFISRKSLKYHVETIHDRKKQSTFQCSICNKAIDAEKDLDTHISEIHIDVAYVRQVLNKHVYSAQKGSKTLQCQFCDTTFSQNCDFNRHVSSVHEGKKKFKCAICDACQINKKCVKQHMKSFCCAFLA